jgi:hypothetical protein
LQTIPIDASCWITETIRVIQHQRIHVATFATSEGTADIGGSRPLWNFAGEDTGAKRKLARLMLSASEPPAKNVPVRPSPVFRSGRARANNRSGAKIHSLLKSAKNETSPITTWNYG